ncbi:hypothetical protein TIFTF001_056290, partial [Ficus carica]
MAMLFEQLIMIDDGEHRSGHGPKRSNRNVPPIRDVKGPKEAAIRYDGAHRKLEAVEELLKGSFHLRPDSFHEGNDVLCAAVLGGYDVGDRGEAEVVGLCCRIPSDQAEPLFGHDE